LIPDAGPPIGGQTTLYPCYLGRCETPLNERELIFDYISKF